MANPFYSYADSAHKRYGWASPLAAARAADLIYIYIYGTQALLVFSRPSARHSRARCSREFRSASALFPVRRTNYRA